MNNRELPFMSEEMQSGESLVWVGQPDRALALKAGIPITVFALLIALLVLHDLPAHYHHFMRHGQWTLWAIFDFMEVFFVIPLVPLALAPVWLYKKACETYYAISNKRVLIFKRGSKRTLQSYERDSLKPVMQTKLFGKVHLLWNAPGMHADSDGELRQNSVLFAALPLDTVYKIGIEFPTITSASQLPPRQ